MTSFRRNRSRRRRMLSRHVAQRQSTSCLPAMGDRGVWRLFVHPLVDRLLMVMLRCPYALMIVAIGAGAGLAIWHIAAIQSAPDAMSNLTGVVDMHASLSPTPTVTPTSDIVRFLAAYNQASALAAAQGHAALLEPYLAPDGPAWQAVVAEYARRASAGERRDATLVRWGVLQSDITSVGGWIDTQEQWDVVITVGGRIVSSRRGVLTRNRYWLRRDADSWRIVDATTIEVIR